MLKNSQTVPCYKVKLPDGRIKYVTPTYLVMHDFKIPYGKGKYFKPRVFKPAPMSKCQSYTDRFLIMADHLDSKGFYEEADRIASLLNDIEKSKESEKVVVFLGGDCSDDNKWREEVKDEFGDKFSFLDPYDENWKAEDNIYDEILAMMNANIIVFYKGGEGTENEKRFLDSLDSSYESFDEIDDLKDFLNKIPLQVQIAYYVPSKETKAPPFWRRNYDYGEGVYQNMDKYKSVKDFLSRKKERQKRLEQYMSKKAEVECMHENTIQMTSEGFPMLYCLDCKQIIDKNKKNRGDWSKDYFVVNVSPYNDIGFFDAKPIDKIDYYS